MVYSTAIRLLANPTEAEDVSQEVFLRAYEHYEQIRESPAAGGWLKRVATNLCLNHLARYRSRWSFFSDLVSGPGEGEAEEQEFASPENISDQIDAADRHKILEDALQKLSATKRVPLVLFHLEGFSYEEIAARLGVSLGKVKTDIFRGRQELRRVLEGVLAPGGTASGKLSVA